MIIKNRKIRESAHELISKLSKLEFIESITLVGSHSDLKISPSEKVIDLDFVIIANKLIYRNYKTISKIFSEIARKFSDSNYSFFVERKIGPFKPQSLEKKFTIVLHQIIFDIKGYRDYSQKSALASYDWQRTKPLYGNPLNYFFKIKKINTNQLIKERLGINFYLDALSKKEGVCIIYKKNKEKVCPKIKKIKLSKNQQIELMYHALFNTQNNMLKVISGKNEIYSFYKLNKTFFGKFENTKKYKDLFLRLHILKTSIRSKKKTSVNLNDLRQQTIFFLNDLKKILAK
ncbi:MAG: hypothetical protein NTX24_02955 [Candidatus Pacearchaeota archaeon]|nr:hypothetical protein [Candidatus Pacearchaeota archaeon]